MGAQLDSSREIAGRFILTPSSTDQTCNLGLRVMEEQTRISLIQSLREVARGTLEKQQATVRTYDRISESPVARVAGFQSWSRESCRSIRQVNSDYIIRCRKIVRCV